MDPYQAKGARGSYPMSYKIDAFVITGDNKNPKPQH